MLDLANDSRTQTNGEHGMSSMHLNNANVLGALPASYASLSSLSSLLNTSMTNPPLIHGTSSTSVREASPAASTANANAAKPAPRQLTNWFQPILWTLIDETAEKVCFVCPVALSYCLSSLQSVF